MNRDLHNGTPRDRLRLLQLEKLQMLLNRAYLNVDFYRRQMDSLAILPEDVMTLDDFRRLPLTSSDDLAEHYPYGLFATPLRSIVRLKVAHSRAGRPIVVGYTRRDISTWQSLMVDLFRQVGVSDRDIVQVAFNYSLFPGAFTFNHATELIGATLAPSATLSARLQLSIMQDFRSTVLASYPSFALHLAETMEKLGISSDQLHLRCLILGPDVLPHSARQRLESILGVPVYALYGVGELVEPGMAGECSARDGFHLAEEHFLVELIQPATGQPAAPGEEGELVVTTLSSEAYPLIRYRTGDITTLQETPCACGLTSLRVGSILRRADNRVSVRGVPIYPDRIRELLQEKEERLDDFRLLITRRHGIGEQLEVLVSLTESSGQERSRPGLVEMLRSHRRRSLGLGVRVQIVERARLPKAGLTAHTVFLDAPSGRQPGQWW